MNIYYYSHRKLTQCKRSAINLEVRREMGVESIEMAFKAKGLTEISNRMRREREKRTRHGTIWQSTSRG